MKRNIILEIEETKQKLLYTINEAIRDKNIPFYFLEPIIKDIAREIYNGSQQEIQTLIRKENEEIQKEAELKKQSEGTEEV